MAKPAIAHESTPLSFIQDQITEAQEDLASAQRKQWGLVDVAKQGPIGTILAIACLPGTVPQVEDARRHLASFQGREEALLGMGAPPLLSPLQEVDLRMASVQAELSQLSQRERRGIQVATKSVFGGFLAVRDSLRTASLREELLQEKAVLEEKRRQVLRQARQEASWQRADPEAPAFALGSETVHNVRVRTGGLGPFGGMERHLTNITQGEINQLQEEGHKVQILEIIEPYPL